MKKNKITLNEGEFRNMIRKIVKESLENYGDFSQFETKDSDGEDGRLSDMNTESDEDAEVRDSIEKFFKQPGVNNAPYAYSLYGVDAEDGKDTNDMKNARKKFADCVNHEKNENGYPYSFNSSELNRLKGMISGNQLSEAINKAMKKILENTNKKSLNESFNSNKLAQMVKMHGGINTDVTHKFVLCALNQITDENFVNVVKNTNKYYDNATQNSRLLPLVLNDGTWLYVDTSQIDCDAANRSMNNRTDKSTQLPRNQYVPSLPSYKTALNTKKAQLGLGSQQNYGHPDSPQWVRRDYNERRNNRMNS